MDLIWGMLSLDQHINTVIAMHGDLTYVILFLMVFCEMGLLPLFFLPGDPLLFFCGTLRGWRFESLGTHALAVCGGGHGQCIELPYWQGHDA